MRSVWKALYPPRSIEVAVCRATLEPARLAELKAGWDQFSATPFSHIVAEFTQKNRLEYYWVTKQLGTTPYHLGSALRWIFRGLSPMQAVILTRYQIDTGAKINALRKKPRSLNG